MTCIGMFPHNGSANHGCEAIVRSTVELLRNVGRLVVFSERIAEDKFYMPDLDVPCHSPKKEITRFSGQYFRATFLKRFKGKKDAFEEITFEPLKNACKNGIFMSIGGDLYCYETPFYMYRIHRYLKENGAKSVLWGCSVEPELIDDEMEKDLASYDLICARESVTYDVLRKINANTILSVDPAFSLPSQKTELPRKDYVGINISPMIVEREKSAGIALINYANLIRHILQTTDCIVALIPHVIWENTDDRTTLSELKNLFSDNERVVVINDMNCMKLKYVISNARMFVGARTHATIAAYSTGVPTLTVGYSVKAKGIAKDLFGAYEKYVLPVQSLETPFDLTNAFAWMAEREEIIRTHLKSVMPEYKSRIQVAVNAVTRLEQST